LKGNTTLTDIERHYNTNWHWKAIQH